MKKIIALILLATVMSGAAPADEPTYDGDRIFADGFQLERQVPPWWECWPFYDPPPPGTPCL